MSVHKAERFLAIKALSFTLFLTKRYGMASEECTTSRIVFCYYITVIVLLSS